MDALPIDPAIPEIQRHLRKARNLLVMAPPGSGKTTRVPSSLLEVFAGQVWVLEPRRLAARMAARRVAQERGERLGRTVGYQVRFEEVAGPQTRLRFMTEGVLTRRILSDPQLGGVDAVVLDEFHERHLEGDLALALLHRLQQTARPALRLVVMSATLDAAPLLHYFGACPIVRAEGRLHELAVTHLPYSGTPLEQQVAGALADLLHENVSGDVLVFLPGAAEIRRAARACQPIAARANRLLVPLHGDLSPEEQDRAVLPAECPKVILSTNVAESSVTIEGVRAVIDSGLARVASDSPWTGLPQLHVARVSRASAAQRAGRAGRTGPGRVIRLYPAEDFARRPEYDAPEIMRRELSPTLLTLKAAGAEGLRWLDPPPPGAVTAAEDLLGRLGALNEARDLTPLGHDMAHFPLHPRLARLVIEAHHRGAGAGGCSVAALLSAGDSPRRAAAHARRAGSSDVLALLDSDWSPAARRALHHIRGYAARLRLQKQNSTPEEQALLIAILTAFPDRVARRRSALELVLASGGALLADESVVRSELMVAVDAEQRPDRGLPLVRMASAIEPEWLIELFSERVGERQSLEWNRAAERVEAVSALVYDGLVIEESRSGRVDDEQAARLLAEKAWEAGLARFTDPEEIGALMNRVAFAARHSALQPLGDTEVRAALESLSAGLRSFRELEEAARDGGLLRVLEKQVSAGRALDQLAPERVALRGGRQVRVHYPPNQPPWIASRLQDFFGMREAPRVAGGKVPLVIHLLAPNQRAVQITSDLAGFWERDYPRVRRELSRRYPRHRWPENPLAPNV